jgi:hypothetical protein
MLHPAHVDGRSLVILRRRQRLIGSCFCVVASGELEHDGETLFFLCDRAPQVITDQELASVMVVKPDTQIWECRGFDLFLIQD